MKIKTSNSQKTKNKTKQKKTIVPQGTTRDLVEKSLVNTDTFSNIWFLTYEKK